MQAEGDAGKSTSLAIEGMTCANCSSAIETHLMSLAGGDSVSVSLLTNKAVIEY